MHDFDAVQSLKKFKLKPNSSLVSIRTTRNYARQSDSVKAPVFKSPEGIKVMDVPRSVLSGGQMLIKVSKCGICGSNIGSKIGQYE